MERTELANYFEENFFIPHLKARTKDDVLQELVTVLVDNNFVRNGEIVMEMLRKREMLGTTGIGKGIAIPHGRSTAAPRVGIVFGRSVEGINFDSVDGQPVFIVFMIIAPPTDAKNLYLPILGKLVTILDNDIERDRIKNSVNFSEFIQIIKGEDSTNG